MFDNYVVLLDFLTVVLSFLVLLNLRINNNGKYSKEILTIKHIWSVLFVEAILHISINILSFFALINNTFYSILYFIFLGLGTYSILLVCLFSINITNPSEKVLKRVNVLLKTIFILSIFGNAYLFLSIHLDPSYTFQYHPIKDISYIYEFDLQNPVRIFSAISIITVFYIFYLNRHRVMRNIFKNIVTLIPLSIMLMIADLTIRITVLEVSADSPYWSILPISVNGVALSIFIIFYSQPYDKIFGFLGQDAFDKEINENISNKIDTYSISLLFISTNELNNINSDLTNKANLGLAMFMNKFNKDIISFRRGKGIVLFLPKSKFKKDEALSIFQKLAEFLSNLNEKKGFTYKLIFFEINKYIQNVQEYYELDFFVKDKCKINSTYFVTKKDIDTIKSRMPIEKELIDISEKGDINDPRVILTGQVIYDKKSNSYKTTEILVRLQSERTGFIMPDDFIPLAEKLNVINTITKIVLYKTCLLNKRLEKQNINLDAFTVNISIKDIQDKHFVNDVIKIIQDTNTNPKNIRFELIESLAIINFDLIIEQMKKLQKQGFVFYLDDFGSGYSNLDRIVSLPLHTIKFDKSIVWGAKQNIRKYHILKDMTKLFQSLGLRVLYEGIENDEYEDMAQRLDVRYLQGYKYSKPLKEDDLEKFLLANKS